MLTIKHDKLQHIGLTTKTHTRGGPGTPQYRNGPSQVDPCPLARNIIWARVASRPVHCDIGD